MDFAWPRGLVELAEEARVVASQHGGTDRTREDSWVASFDREFSRELGRRGWLGMTWPAEVGGGNRAPIERFVVTEELILHGAPLGASWVADRQIGPTLLAFGTREQQERFIPPMVSGDACWCIGMSEPDAGSDLAAVSTRAVAVDGGFVVDGSKVWTSWAHEADYCYLIARTNPDAPKHRGLSELVVDMRSPGISIHPIRDMTGAEHFCEVRFEGVHVPGDHLVGDRDGSWRQVMRQLEHERAGIDRLVSNRLLFLDVLADADRDDPLVRQEAAAIEASFRIGRLLVLRGVLEQGPPGFSAATKVVCTELEQRVARFAARTVGASATLWGRVARAACYAPAYTIQGGTSMILRNVLAERALGLPR